MPTPLNPGRLTVEEFLQLPDDGNRYELSDGKLLVAPLASTGHVRVQRRLCRILQAAAPSQLDVEYGGYGIRVGDSLFKPDLVVVNESAVAVSVLAVDAVDVLLAVEVLSPGNPGSDRVVKMNKYAEGGIPNYWIVDEKARCLTAYELVGARSTYVRAAEVHAGTRYRTDRPFEVEFDPADIF